MWGSRARRTRCGCGSTRWGCGMRRYVCICLYDPFSYKTVHTYSHDRPTHHHPTLSQNEPLFVRSLFGEEMADAVVLLRVSFMFLRRLPLWCIYISLSEGEACM